MRWEYVLALPAALAAGAWAAASPPINAYAERLHLKPLPGGHLYAGFNFTASTPKADYDSQHFRYFPRSLGQILQFTHTSELHLRFALGRWDEESWGSRPRNGRREGGTGVELWAWIEAAKRADAERRWDDLVNSLSGLFCASLNFIDQTKTIQPILSFEPEGTAPLNATVHFMHGMLPHEVVCTENLTPFLKMLPCKGKAGVASLLDGHKVFDANWQTMAIDVRSTCGPTDDCGLEISQTVDLVLDVDRSMRPRDSPIPRPPPIEQVKCDESKVYNGPDSCYPQSAEHEMEWSLTRIFGRSIQGSCPVGDRSNAVDITVETPAGADVTVDTELVSSAEHLDARIRHYRLREGREVDVTLPQQVIDWSTRHIDNEVHASRQIIGYGQERGGMHAVITNSGSEPRSILYLESLPWFLRPYIHTLSVSGASIEKMFYVPAKDRRKGTHLELLVEIPARSTVDLTYDFEKAVLRYTEYPPDANRGFDVAPAVIRVLPSNHSSDSQGSYLRTTSLLLPLPTPDFSMPYNVIILTSTVIALGFGSIFNLLTRRFALLDELPPPPLPALVKKIKQRILDVRAKLTGKPEQINDKDKDEFERKPASPALSAESPVTSASRDTHAGLTKRLLASNGSLAADDPAEDLSW